MKKFVSGLLTGIIIAAAFSAFAATLTVKPNTFPVIINGVKSIVDGYNINGSTYLKLTDLEKAGLKVVFNSAAKQIEITSSFGKTGPEGMGHSEDITTELPSGAQLVDKQYNNSTYKAISYNGYTYISINDLNNVFGVKMVREEQTNGAQPGNMQQPNPPKSIKFAKGDKTITVDLSDANNVLSVGRRIYLNYALFADIIK
ncbi:MAG: hypothetical protein NUV45_05385 [Tepidanaerobacteraceae bacterium]|jgi:hypothetical protein|nr:hypothetical protein [Tepidanaerobacteraceae bacterium]